ncbi:MAG: hypothetical protein KDD46_06215 [Bdellovibrionales bacterium]|nr:hypothetical protein [Bdellovibrionales bacterium]
MKVRTLIVSLFVAVMMMGVVPEQAFAGHSARGKGYQHKKHVQQARRNVRHKHRTIHHRRVVQRPVVVHRHVYPRVVHPHYHQGYYTPCYDAVHTHGSGWNLNIGSGGVGFGFYVD